MPPIRLTTKGLGIGPPPVRRSTLKTTAPSAPRGGTIGGPGFQPPVARPMLPELVNRRRELQNRLRRNRSLINQFTGSR